MPFIQVLCNILVDEYNPSIIKYKDSAIRICNTEKLERLLHKYFENVALKNSHTQLSHYYFYF